MLSNPLPGASAESTITLALKPLQLHQPQASLKSSSSCYLCLAFACCWAALAAFHTVLCPVMPCHAALCRSLLCCAVPCRTVPCCTVTCPAVLCHAMPQTTTLFPAALCHAMLCRIMLHHHLPCCAMLSYLCYAVLCHTMPSPAQLRLAMPCCTAPCCAEPWPFLVTVPCMPVCFSSLPSAAER